MARENRYTKERPPPTTPKTSSNVCRKRPFSGETEGSIEVQEVLVKIDGKSKRWSSDIIKNPRLGSTLSESKKSRNQDDPI